MHKYVKKTEAYTSVLVRKLKITAQHHGQILQFLCPGEQMNIEFCVCVIFLHIFFLVSTKEWDFLLSDFLIKRSAVLLFVAVVK